MLCISNLSLAQANYNLSDHDSKSYYFGITLGVNKSRFQLNHHTQFLLNDTVQVVEPLHAMGIELGLSATARLTTRFDVRFNPQLIFTERNIFYKLKYPDPIDGIEVIKKVESIIFSFPLQIKFNSDRIGNFRVYMLGGVKADIDLAANARARRAEYLVKLEKLDYGVELGMGFNFYFPSFIFSPEIKISNGLKNIHGRDENLKYSNVLDRIQSRMIMFSIHLEG
ncbi:MAG: PorT family protein [Chitinophagaceae bacterium]|nr:MAG: PorT family protein [Chitinophagaceae bacterium]